MNIVNKYRKKLLKLQIDVRKTILNNGVNAFWWTGPKNFGDLLTPELFYKYGVTPVETPAETADIIGVGSLIHMIPEDYDGIILGTGLIEDLQVRLTKAEYAAVRGELTKKNLDLPETTPTGDLGLLANKLIENKTVKKRYDVGIVPHFVDKKHAWLRKTAGKLGKQGVVIDVQDTAKNVIKQIGQCELIVSSSLHGIIVADALEIPNVWIELSDNVTGFGFKFRDYNSSIDYEQQPLRITPTTTMAEVERLASQKNSMKISSKCIELEAILKKTLTKCSDNY